ncbi:hypothetical protein ABVC46_02020 [Lactobacillus crispatus]|uniref:hypothetical protein n=1 Tax=Lactobacillus crispatus TaxID=47770 RepID=UPI00336A5528
MTNKIYIFKYSKSAVAFKLTSQQVQLLRFIGMFGFVTTNQLNLLWSVIVKYPTSLSPSILSKWCRYNGLCNLIPISAKRTNKKENLMHNTITLTNQARKWLASIDVLPYSFDRSAINTHNEQAIETIVQSLYTATFGSSILSCYLPYLTDLDHHYYYCAQAIKGAQLKGVIKGANQNNDIIASQKGQNKGASQKVLIQIPQLITTDTTNINYLFSSINNFSTIRSIDYIGCLSPKIREILTDGSNRHSNHLLNTYHVKTDSVNSSLNITISTDSGVLRPKSYKSPINSYINNSDKNKNARFHNEFSNSMSNKNVLQVLFYQHLPIIFHLLQMKLALNLPTLTFHYLTFKTALSSRDTLHSLLGGEKAVTLTHFLPLFHPSFTPLFIAHANKDHALRHKVLATSMRCSNTDYLNLKYPIYASLSRKKTVIFTSFLPPFFLLFLNVTHHSQAKTLKRKRINGLFDSFLSLTSLYPNLSYQLASNATFKAISGRDAHIASRPKPRKNQKHPHIKKIANQKDDYSKNLFNQQSNLINLLGDNSEKNKEFEVKHYKGNSKQKSHQPKVDSHIQPKQVKGSANLKENDNLAFSYFYPNERVKVEVRTFDKTKLPLKINNLNQLSPKQRQLLILIAYCNIFIDRWYKSIYHTADYDPKWHLNNTGDKPKYPLLNASAQRGMDLISNPSFDINNYDYRSFNQQFGYTFAKSKDLPFVADEMISFTRHQRRHEIFLELDNRTESNQTQIHKIMNYIWYALSHKNKDIDMIIAITDGSLKSRKLTKFTNLGRKIGNMTSLFLRTYLNTDQNKKAYLGSLYRQASNLNIYITGVSEAHLDIASILVGSNYITDQIITIRQLAHKLATKTRWNVRFNPSQEITNLLHAPNLLFNTGNTSSVLPIVHPSIKGILRHAQFQVQPNWTFGALEFTDKLTGKVTRQIILNAQEHEIGAIISMYNLLNQKNTELGEQLTIPILVYPHRIRTATSIVLPQCTKKYIYNSSYTPIFPYMIQPLYGDNLTSHEQLRWLTIQYAKAIHNYYLIGAVNQASLKKKISFGDARIKLLNPKLQTSARSYQELQALAKKMKPNEFVDQLCLNEIPLGLFQFLMLERWPQGEYSVPRYVDLPYLTENTEKQFYSSPEQDSLCIYGLDKMKPDKRSKIKI